jgi:hypothetical protein
MLRQLLMPQVAGSRQGVNEWVHSPDESNIVPRHAGLSTHDPSFIVQLGTSLGFLQPQGACTIMLHPLFLCFNHANHSPTAAWFPALLCWPLLCACVLCAGRAPSGAAMLSRITQLINSVLAEVQGAAPLTEQDVVALIGG